MGDQNGFSRTLHGGERRDYDDRSIETSAKGGVRLGSAGRRATHSPPPSQISKVAAASTIPVTNAVAQANTRKSFRIPVIAAPCVHGTVVLAVAGRH